MTFGTKLLLGGRGARSFTLPRTRSGELCCTLFTVYTVCHVKQPSLSLPFGLLAERQAHKHRDVKSSLMLVGTLQWTLLNTGYLLGVITGFSPSKSRCSSPCKLLSDYRKCTLTSPPSSCIFTISSRAGKKIRAPNNKPINLDTRCHMRLNRKIKRMEVNRGQTERKRKKKQNLGCNAEFSGLLCGRWRCEHHRLRRK